jgi:hypothetical protein
MFKLLAVSALLSASALAQEFFLPTDKDLEPENNSTSNSTDIDGGPFLTA